MVARRAIVLDARSARMGGGVNFVAELSRPLKRRLGQLGAGLAVLAGPPGDGRERAARRRSMLRADAILHAGNRATWAPKARQVVCVRDRLLLSAPTTARMAARRAVLSAAVRTADALVVPSESMLAPLDDLKRLVRSGAAVCVIPHGRPQWHPPPTRPLSDPLTLLFPSHVGAHKNFGLLAKVLSDLPVPAMLTLTARPDELVGGASLRSLFAGALDRVRFLGQVGRDSLERLYADHDVLVFPSRVESFGLPLVEAMVMNMPIVATRSAWAEEVAATSAAYAGPDDPAEWVEALTAIADSGVRRNGAGLQRAVAFDWDRAAEAYARILLQ